MKPIEATRASFIASLVLTALLHLVPFGASLLFPLALLSTLVHEMGHGIAGLLVGAHFDSFQMWQNGSGVALVTGQLGRLSQGIVAAGGLVGPSIVSAFFFITSKNSTSARWSLLSFASILFLAEIMVVTGWFSYFFIGLLAAVCVFIAIKTPLWFMQAFQIFIATQLALSVFSRSDYLFTDTAITSQGPMPSDVANMAQALFLPYWFWGAVCGLFSIAVLVGGIKILWRNPSSMG